MRKLCKNKDADQLCSNSTAQLISPFVFAIRIVQSLLNPNFQSFSVTVQVALCW